ncbi:NAD(P)-binding domain-containing protein [Fournierella sp.]
MSYTFGFIGVGNMGGALARAACRWNPRQVVLTNRSMEKAISLAPTGSCW